MANDKQRGFVALPPPRHELKPFTHAPLDHLKASLRLIRVLEAISPEGYIQCEVRHATIEASYICLSYVWGEEGRGHTIILDKQPFRIRSNLYGFLVTARRKRRLLENWLWVDALSIDQTNVEERNHQVQQMGKIFSRAKEALSWLGNNSEIAAHLDRVEQAYIQGSNVDLDHHRGTIEYRQRLEFHQSEYWRRAWITQEVALACQVTLCAGLAEMTFELLPLSYFDGMPPTQKLQTRGRTGLKGRSLIYLINWFAAKESHERRDCIYSLLALCGEGSDLQVDYNSSETMLTRKIMECCNQSFCLCAIKIVVWTLGLHRPDFYDVGTQSLDLTSEPFAYMTLPVIRGAPPLWTHCSELDETSDSEPTRCNQHAVLSCIELSREEKMAVFVSSKGDILLVLFPKQICPSSSAALFEIQMIAGASHSTLVACDVYGRKTTKSLVNGISLKLDLRSMDELCQVFFSFKLLLNLIHGLYFPSVCHRVQFQGTQDIQFLREPLIRLCS
ncbi:hypothetical protein GT037_000283 [Alternaria burnsii]|uniref:Heterokaryon incompatibility domain-containing protein n=1 Tax=Alternaria burnsii TaxID=1187904 RepID=A0A8H7EJH0_9PLEO|nr:uncharacterized protein GT037_000283 [Alternaria burnsii]KAF7681307.1 hypothetical protein GT037_000283 [Alternaria burnsii]